MIGRITYRRLEEGIPISGANGSEAAATHGASVTSSGPYGARLCGS